jgi:hypothetical protein
VPHIQPRDLLRECNDRQAPLDEFQQGFCGRCINPECSRSLYGQSRFDVRVNTWEDRLFTNTPRMDSTDPRYNEFAGKKFLTLDTGRTPEIRGAWVDPRDVPADASVPAAVSVVVPPEPRIIEVPAVEEPMPPTTPARNPARVPTHLLLSNTPAPRGVMVGQPPPEAAARDPWAPPEAPKDPVVAVGSRVKMGGSGV